MMAQHKWHKEIKAWADGAEIEMRRLESWGWRDWETYKDFYWYEGDVHEYRIKPQSKEQEYLYVYMNRNGEMRFFWNPITPLKTDLTYQGKIKLEVDDVGTT
jgi:hypothetical protein